MIFTFVGELSRLDGVIKEFPDSLPLICDPSAKNKDSTQLFLRSLPVLDHVINLSGDEGLEIISKTWINWK